MSRRDIMIDWNIMVNIKKDNVPAANVLKKLIATANVFYPQQVWNEAKSEADRRLLKDSGMKKAPNFVSDPEARQAIREKQKMNSYMSKADLNIAVPANLMKAEVFTLDGRFAKALERAGIKVAPESYSTPRVDSTRSAKHHVGRRLLDLAPLNITGDGRILPMRSVVKAAPPRVVETWNRKLQVGPDGRVIRAPAGKPPPSPPNIVNGPRTPSGARTTADDRNQVHPVARPSPAPPAPRPTNRPAPASTIPNTPLPAGSTATIDGKRIGIVPVDPAGSYGTNHEWARTIQPPKVDPATIIQNGVNSVNSRAQAVGGGVTLFFRGTNFIVHEINDGIQERALKANWSQLEKSIPGRLAEDPTLGALIIGQYAVGQKSGNANSSPMQPTASFMRLETSFGFDREDAWARYNAKSQMRDPKHGVPDSLEVHWFPPKQPVDVTKLPTPFPAAGLATFVPGREELVKVFFKDAGGFDERWRSVEKVNTAYDILAFFYLLPPDRVNYQYNGEQTKDIPVLVEPPGEVAHSELMHIHVPVVELDSKVNPYNATAAMIYPADNFTARRLEDTTPMGGRDLLKYKYKVEKLRWVKPQKMRVLRVFSEDQLQKQLAEHDRKAEYDRIRLRSSNGAQVTCGPQHAHRGSWCF